MNYIKSPIRDFYLGDSRLENIFVNEYMPSAPGDYVKVFIYASMYAEHNIPITERRLSEQLNVGKKEIDKAWEYWEQMGAVRRIYNKGNRSDYTVEFLNLKEILYGNIPEEPEKEEPKPNPLGKDELRKLFIDIEELTGRPLNPNEIKDIISWNRDLGISVEIIRFCFDYCNQKNKTNIKYVGTVLRNWTTEGLESVDEIKSHLAEVEERFYRYDRVLKALGMGFRRPTEQEEKMMDHWFDDMGYNMDRVLEACSKTSGISNPNFNYVNKVLENWEKEAGEDGRSVNEAKPVSMAVLNRYYDYLKEKAQTEAEERKNEIYSRLPRIKEIDGEIMKIGSTLSRALVMADSSVDTRKLNDDMERLNEDRAIILAENNYDIDYTDVKYRCNRCNDTGITDTGERCTCVEDRMEEAAIWEKERK